MPRFVFNVMGDVQPNAMAVDLPNMNAAREEALKTACGILAERTSDFWENGGEWQMTVADERGMTLFLLTLYATDAPAGRGR